jgi:hypothetical protein
MNRRDFFTVVGGASVASLAGVSSVLAAEQTTTFYLRGLVMVAFENQMLRIGFPKAPGHKATLQIQPVNGTKRTITLKGNGSLQTNSVASAQPKIFIPEIVQMSEFYGPGVKTHFEKCPSVIEIPLSAIRSISTSSVSKDRWTFVRADTGAEVNTFRPRQIAEGLKIELSSHGTLKLDGLKLSIPLETTQELASNYEPTAEDKYPSMFEDHFAHYFAYVERPPAADFLVVPKKLTGNSNPTPRVGNRFMFDGGPICYLILISDLLGLG